ncbi:helix-turn-helix transcriptional regulator [Sneathiella sp.]|uniref:helix-turn-helix domain-containing protein n=1 Tax=Sneathiella sp. TaxID=1964365 RepID=UPI0025FF983A|nr:helix-turn-helix transcriptional regulator [Sneathiella sp.]|tara:strand:+ start:691 stop:1149 length:459 start_codon:yes stop_codon:yes gene_type:complete
MSFSQEPFRVNTLNPNEPIGEEDLAYFRQRMKNRAFQEIMRLFVDRAEKDGLTKSNIASKLEKDKSQISRMFAGPMNWTIDTLSDLSLALGYEASVVFNDLSSSPRHNYSHPLTQTTIIPEHHFHIKDGIGEERAEKQTSTPTKNVRVTINA